MKPQLSIVKIGGNIIDNPKALDHFLGNFAKLPDYKLLVHGGGKIATSLSKKLNIEAQMIDGRRVTNQDDLDIVTMVYAGLINKNIVASLIAKNCTSLGLTGADLNCITSKIRASDPVDYGFVGDITHIDSEKIKQLLVSGETPVFSPITHDGKGQLLNTNADTLAAELAIALTDSFDVHLFYCFEKNGVLSDENNEDSVINTLSFDTYQELVKSGVITHGMRPKLHNSFLALNHDVKQVVIGNATIISSIEGATKLSIL